MNSELNFYFMSNILAEVDLNPQAIDISVTLNSTGTEISSIMVRLADCKYLQIPKSEFDWRYGTYIAKQNCSGSKIPRVRAPEFEPREDEVLAKLTDMLYAYGYENRKAIEYAYTYCKEIISKTKDRFDYLVSDRVMNFMILMKVISNTLSSNAVQLKVYETHRISVIPMTYLNFINEGDLNIKASEGGAPLFKLFYNPLYRRYTMRRHNCKCNVPYRLELIYSLGSTSTSEFRQLTDIISSVIKQSKSLLKEHEAYLREQFDRKQDHEWFMKVCKVVKDFDIPEVSRQKLVYGTSVEVDLPPPVPIYDTPKVVKYPEFENNLYIEEPQFIEEYSKIDEEKWGYDYVCNPDGLEPWLFGPAFSMEMSEDSDIAEVNGFR